MQLPYSIRLHQASNINKREVREVSESRYPRSADYIYIYSLQAKSTSNARRQKDMAYSLFPVCLFVCRHSADIHVSAETACRKTFARYLTWYFAVGKGKGKDFFLLFFVFVFRVYKHIKIPNSLPNCYESNIPCD